MWRVLGASVEGSGHLARGAGCDDAHCVLSMPDGGLAIAVADGAGSAANAALGARVAVEAALTCLEGGGNPAAALVAARLSLEGTVRASDPPVELAALATTLLVVLVRDRRVATAQIGDGAVVVRDADGLSVLAADAKGEYLNETTFVTSSRWADEARVADRCDSGVSGVAVLSDGLQLLALDLAAGRAHEPFFAPLFAFAESPDADDAELARFLASERVCARTDDDKTLVLAVRSAKSGS
jgi:hypothetical protein